MDTNTLRQTKGHFVRICVEGGLNAPLLLLLVMNGKKKNIVDEGLHLICFSCGRYGHASEHCPNKSTEVRNTCYYYSMANRKKNRNRIDEALMLDYRERSKDAKQIMSMGN